MKYYTEIRIYGIIILLLTIAATSAAQPPKPPEGKKWVLNLEMSDEFDADSPGHKWNVYDKKHSWNRTAAFDKRVHQAVKVTENGKDNYYLAMNPMWYDEDERFEKYGRTFLFAGGGMDTKEMATYGYFEVRIKPSDFPMGSGVFMNSRRYTDAPCGEKYVTELDIIENMGYTGPDASDFNNKMHINSHVKPTDENCKRLPYISTGGNLHAPLKKPLGFNTVGVWWKDENTCHFYLDDKYFTTIKPPRPFNIPMPVILTMETYVWGDDDENNAGNPKPLEYMFTDSFRSKEKRAVMYDWVRSWKLVNIDADQK